MKANSTPQFITMLSLLTTFLLSLFLLKLTHTFLWLPIKIQQHFRKQGVRGPAFRPVVGNMPELRRLYQEADHDQENNKPSSAAGPGHFSHDVVRKLVPYYHKWTGMYGANFLYWRGMNPTLMVSDPEMIKEVLVKTGGGSFDKISFNPLTKQLFGQGLNGLAGHTWALHRRIATQAFTMLRVKGWVPEIVLCTRKMMERWEEAKGKRDEFEMEVYSELNILVADVLSRTFFGSNYEQGKNIFMAQERQKELVAAVVDHIYIPGFRFLPTKMNKERKRLEREIRKSIRLLIDTNTYDQENSKNLLSIFMSAHHNPKGEEERLGIEEIINECKTFYFLGKESTALLLNWTLILLGQNQHWQNKARQEVMHVCDQRFPDASDLHTLKIIGNILNETLRLYPPVTTLFRKTSTQIRLGNVNIPANTQFQLPIIGVHHDTKIWGEDANEFNPSRFDQIGKVCPLFCPFALGPRECVGKTFSMVEAKIVLAMIIQKYSFTVAPTYVHAPKLTLTPMPQYGAQIIFRSI